MAREREIKKRKRIKKETLAYIKEKNSNVLL
jgi:hypothetical protein